MKLTEYLDEEIIEELQHDLMVRQEISGEVIQILFIIGLILVLWLNWKLWTFKINRKER